MAEWLIKKFVFSSRISNKRVFGVANQENKTEKLHYKMAGLKWQSGLLKNSYFQLDIVIRWLFSFA